VPLSRSNRETSWSESPCYGLGNNARTEYLTAHNADNIHPQQHRHSLHTCTYLSFFHHPGPWFSISTSPFLQSPIIPRISARLRNGKQWIFIAAAADCTLLLLLVPPFSPSKRITRLHLPSRFNGDEAESSAKEAGQTLFACLPSVFCLAQLPCVRSSPTAARARPDPTLVTCLITWLSRVRGKKVCKSYRRGKVGEMRLCSALLPLSLLSAPMGKLVFLSVPLLSFTSLDFVLTG
jgi:hypothetical protein